jgi:hydrogenase expression/formation protein HypE
VVDPIFFPGGDIGRLAVCGTVNDLSMMGAKPLYLSIGFILEEGFSLDSLNKILLSIKQTVDEAGVKIVTGDTKVVPRGNVDKIFINTSGLGVLKEDIVISGSQAQPGDRILISGPLGCHGMSVLTSREGLGFKSRIDSDVMPLNHLVDTMMSVSSEIHVLRDATRGGVATVLNEIAGQSNVGIELDEMEIPIMEEVRGACELLGFDPLYVANEGVLVAVVSPEDAGSLQKAMHSIPAGKQCKIAGKVVKEPHGKVILQTQIGSHRIVDMLSGEQLPRIC